MPNKTRGYRKADGKTRAGYVPEPRRTILVTVRVAPDEHREWKRAAALEGRSLSEFARHALNAAAYVTARKLAGD